MLARSKSLGDKKPGVEAQVAGGRALDADFKQAVSEKGARYLSTYRALCPTSDDCTVKVGEVPVQWDYGHLTAEGAAYVVSVLAKQDGFTAPDL